MDGSVDAGALREAIARGEWLDLSGADDSSVDGAVLREVLEEDVTQGSSQGLRIRAATFDGPLDLYRLETKIELHLDSCQFKDLINLWGASGVHLAITSSSGAGMISSQICLKGDLSLEGSAFPNGVYLDDARIGGRLLIGGASFGDDDSEVALSAETATIDKGLFMNKRAGSRLEAKGEVRLQGARLGGGVSIEAAHLSHASGIALSAQRLEVDGSFHLLDTEIDGEVNLVGAHIQGQFTMATAAEETIGSLGAIRADGLEVERDAYFEVREGAGCKFARGLFLVGARVGGQLAFVGVTVSGDESYVLNLAGCEVGQDLLVRGEEPKRCQIEGGLNLSGAHVAGRLSIVGASIEGGKALALFADGLRVDGSAVIGGDGGLATSVHGGLRMWDVSVKGSFGIMEADFGQVGGEAFSAARLDVGGSLAWDRVSTEGEVALPGARIGGQFIVQDCEFNCPGGRALELSGVEIGQGMYVRSNDPDRTLFSGEVALLGGEISSQLSVHRAIFENADGHALSADRLRVNGGFFLRQCRLVGETRMAGARLLGQFTLASTSLEASQGGALVCDGFEVGEDLFLRSENGEPFRSVGEIRLLGAKVGGQVSLRGCSLEKSPSDRRPTLNLDGLTVDQGVFLRPTENIPTSVEGEFRLTRLQAAYVALERVVLKNADGLAVSGRGLVVEGDFLSSGSIEGAIRLDGITVKGMLQALLKFDGERRFVNLSDGQFGTLDLVCEGDPHLDLRRSRARGLQRVETDEGRWAKTYLEGFQYETLTPPDRNQEDVDARLEWIGSDLDGYASQPYEQLRSIYRETGFESAARKVGITSQRERRRDAPFLERIGSRLVGVTVGYGYRPAQALLWLLGIVAVGAFLFGCVFSVGESGSGAEITPIETGGDQGSFEPVAYVIDLLIPGIDLGQQSVWTAEGLALWFGILVTASGWLLAAAVLAGISVRRD